MNDVLTGLMFSREQYQALVQVCGDASALPDWAAWNKFQIQAAGRALKQGRWPRPWSVDLDDFISWCERVGFAPCLEALIAYVGVQQGEDGTSLYATEIESDVSPQGSNCVPETPVAAPAISHIPHERHSARSRTR